MNPGWHTIGIRLVYDWHTVVYGDVWWYTMVYGAMCVRYTTAYGGIRWYTGHMWVWYTVGIRLVYDGHTMVYGAPLGMVYDRYTIWYTDVVLHISDWKVR